jgi:ABC-type multidrug transport system ATPase subunit
MRYVFPPGRDVIVGYGNRCDIRLDRLAPVDQLIPDLLLRFVGTHWVAIDRSRNGIFVDGVRLSAVDIHEGQTIAIGDPQRGPRLTFQLTAPADAPAPPAGSPVRPVVHPPPPPAEPATQKIPTEFATQKIPTEMATQKIPIPPATQKIPTEPPTQRIPTPPPAPSQPTFERPTRPIQLPPPGTPVAPAPVKPTPPPEEDEEPKSRGLVERMTDATKKLLPARTDTGSGEVAPSTNRLPLQPGARTIGVAAYELGLTVDGQPLLSSISFTTRPGALIAVVGPSTARNTALIGLLAGARPLSSGVLTVDGHDVQAEPEAMRSRIGLVLRDNREYPQLTVERALGYAAELRLPPHTSPDNRDRVVNQVLDELGLTPHRKTRVAKLPPEALRCVSLAIELVTRPTLLAVDEPGIGLDPEQESHVMALLRRQADLGCVVVVATTALAHLSMYDQVLLLTPAGTLAFAGPPVHLESALGTTSWPDAFAQVIADPQGAHQAFLNRQQASVSMTPPSIAAPDKLPAELTFGQQVRLVARRQVRLLIASRVYFLFLLLLPFAFGALTLLIPGKTGLGKPSPSGHNPHEAIEILAALNIAAVIMGTALTIRDLVGERRIFRREQAIGLSTSAYLVAKLIVFSVAAAIQAAILTTIVVAVKGGPGRGAVLLPTAAVELYVSVAITAIVSAIVGLALSTMGKSLREVLPLLVPAILASLLFAGGLVSLVGTWGFDQVSWLIPAQWGFAAAASTVDLRRVETLAPDNLVWAHYVGWWVFDMVMLVVLGALWAGFVRYRLRPPFGASPKPLHREEQELSDLGG